MSSEKHVLHTLEIYREPGTPSSLANAHNIRDAVVMDPIVPNISIIIMSDAYSIISVRCACLTGFPHHSCSPAIGLCYFSENVHDQDAVC